MSWEVLMGSSASLDRSPRKSWVENSGGLPPYVREVARSIEQRRGKTLSEAIELAIGVMKRWARGGGDVSAETRTKAANAVRQWEQTKSRNKARQVATSHVRSADTVELANDGSVLLSHATDDGLMVLSSVHGSRVVELARYVRTEAGSKRYGRPVGSLISPGGKRGGASKSSGGSGRSGGGSGASGGRSRSTSGAAKSSGSVGKIGAGAAAGQRRDAQGKVIPKGQKTGADYVREGLARREAAEQRKVAAHEGKKDNQLRQRQKQVAREWLEAKQAGTPATDRKQRERRAEVNAIGAELNRRKQQRPPVTAVGPNATGADRFARMGEMERRTALRGASDSDLKQARNELGMRVGSGRSDAHEAVKAELARRGGGTATAEKPSRPAPGVQAEKQARTDAAGSRLKVAERSDGQLDKMQRRERSAVQQGRPGAQPGVSAVDDERNRRRSDLADEAKKVNRVFSQHSSEQRATNAASHRQGPRQRKAVGDYYYTHPDIPNRAFDSRDQAARAAVQRKGATDLDKPATSPSPTGKPSGPSPAKPSTGKPATSSAKSPSKPQGGALDRPGGMDAQRRSPAPLSSDGPASDAKRTAAPGTVASPPKAPAGKDPGKSARPGPEQDATPKPAQAGTREQDRPDTSAPKSSSDAPKRHVPTPFPARKRTQGDDEDDALFEHSRQRAEARKARGERLPDPFADDQPSAPRKPAAPAPSSTPQGGAATPKSLRDLTDDELRAEYQRADATRTSGGQMQRGRTTGEISYEEQRRQRAWEQEQGRPDSFARSPVMPTKGGGQTRLPRPQRQQRPGSIYEQGAPEQTPTSAPSAPQAPAGGDRLQQYAQADEQSRARLVGQMSPQELDTLDAALQRAESRASDDNVRAVLSGRRGEIDRARMAQRTAGMTDRPVANAQDRQTPAGGAPSRPRALGESPANRQETAKERNARLIAEEDAQQQSKQAQYNADPATLTPEQRAQVANRMRMEAAAASTPAQASEMRRRADEIEQSGGDNVRALPTRATPATATAPQASAPVAPPQATARPEQGGPAGSPNLSRLGELDDATLNAAAARATEREYTARQADPRRAGQPYRDAKLAADTLRAEQNRRQQSGGAPRAPQAPQAAAPAARFDANALNVGDRVRLTGTQWRAPGDVEVVQTRTDGYVVQHPGGRREFVETSDVEGPAGPAPEQGAPGAGAPQRSELNTPGTAANVQARQDAQGAANQRAEQQGGLPFAAEDLMGRDENTLFGQQQPAPQQLGRTGSGTKRLTGAQIRGLQAQLMRETDPEKKAALRARIMAGRGMGGAVKQMSQPHGGGLELAMSGTPFGKGNPPPGKRGKGRKLADLSDEQLDAVEKRAAGKARGRSGLAARQAAQAMVKVRGEKRRRKGQGASSGKPNRPPAFVKGLSQAQGEALEFAQRPTARAVNTAERAAQIVNGTALGEYRHCSRGA